MKKFLCISLAAVMAFAMVSLSGCKGGEEQEPTEEPTTTEATTTTEPTTEKVTYKTIYKSKLDALSDQYGEGLTGGKLVDMDSDGTPEMIVIHDMNVEIFGIKDEEAVSLYEGKAGLRYGQTDASYEVLVNESITPTTVILYNAKDEWVDENITAVSISGGTVSTEVLKAATDGENDTPAREELQTFSIDGADVSSGDYNAEYTRLTEGADSIDPMSADLAGLKASLEE